MDSGSQDSSVSIVTSLGTERSSIPGWGTYPDLAPRPEKFWVPPSLVSSGYRGFFYIRVKRPGRETDYLSLSSAEVKNVWSYTTTILNVFMAWC
jgi:hypothetical protein